MKCRIKRLADEKDQHVHAMDGDDGHNTETGGAHSQACTHQGAGKGITCFWRFIVLKGFKKFFKQTITVFRVLKNYPLKFLNPA